MTLPCCAQSTGCRALKYLRVFWLFYLLQECTACVTHRQPKWSVSSISQDHHNITFTEGKKSTDLLQVYLGLPSGGQFSNLQHVWPHLFLHVSCKQYSHFSVFVGVKFRKKLLDQISCWKKKPRIPKHIWKMKEKNNNTKAPGALSEMLLSLCQHFLVITEQSTTKADGNLISFSDICFTKIHY